MADKKITDLQLRDSVEADLSVPSDDGIQTYRITAAQIRDFILSAGAVTRDKIDESQRIPIGSVFPFAGTGAPTGYLVCDGSAVSRTTYASLFAVIGETHGQGDDSTTFNLPDYRGRFLRGVDGAQGRDPDRASRTAMNTGGNTGDNVGSLQGHAFQTHTHIQNAHSHGLKWSYTNDGGADVFRSGGGSGTGTSQSFDSTATNQDAAATGTHAQASANESRPVNAYVNYIIKI